MLKDGRGPSVFAAQTVATLEDPELSSLLEAEKLRQRDAIHLLAPSMLVPEHVQSLDTKVLANLDGEGYLRTDWQRDSTYEEYAAEYQRKGPAKFNPVGPAPEYIELLAERRVGKLMGTDESSLFVNVQPSSGSIANLAVLGGLVEPGSGIVSLATSSGGHLSHGAAFHMTGQRYLVTPFEMARNASALDYQALRQVVVRARPAALVIGASSYPRHIDWCAIRAIADEVEALLVADIAHFAGLVPHGLYPNPTGVADATTFVGYKTLGGGKNGIIVTKTLAAHRKIRRSLFPGIQGSPRLEDVAVTAAAARYARGRTFAEWMRRAVALAQHSVEAFAARGLQAAFGGTDTHMVVLDIGAGANEFVAQLERMGLICNANILPGDLKPAEASGLRLGWVSLAELGGTPKAVEEIVDVIADALALFVRGAVSSSALEALQKRVLVIKSDHLKEW